MATAQLRILTANIDGIVGACKAGFFRLPHVVESDIFGACRKLRLTMLSRWASLWGTIVFPLIVSAVAMVRRLTAA